jgi:ribosomal protein S7
MKRTNTLLIGFPYVLGLSSRYKKALAWLSMSIKLKTKKTFTFKIFQEIYDIIFFGSGSSIKKKSEFYSAAISIKRNKMFRW